MGQGREQGRGRGVQAAVVAYLLWGGLTVYWKQLHGLNSFELIAWRVVSAAVVMAIVIGIGRRWAVIRAALRTPTTRMWIVVASVLLTINWATYVWAVGDDRVIETALGYFLSPLATMAVGVTFLGERLTRLKQVSVALAVVAVAVLTVSYGRLPWVAVVLALSWTGYATVKRQVALGASDGLAAETLVLVLPAAAVAASGWWRVDGVAASATTSDWVLIAASGIVTAIPLTLFGYAAQRVPFTILGPLNYLVPLINFGLGALVYDEPLPPSRLAGFGLVWIALVVSSIDTYRTHNPRADGPARADPG